VFEVTSNASASPWGQASAFLADVATFPRKALSDSFFLRGLKVSEDDLIDAMNIADDEICRVRNNRGIKDRCRVELELLVRIQKADIGARERCELVSRLIAGNPIEGISDELQKMERS
jgi:hypothetical protein